MCWLLVRGILAQLMSTASARIFGEAEIPEDIANSTVAVGIQNLSFASF